MDVTVTNTTISAFVAPESTDRDIALAIALAIVESLNERALYHLPNAVMIFHTKEDDFHVLRDPSGMSPQPPNGIQCVLLDPKEVSSFARHWSREWNQPVQGAAYMLADQRDLGEYVTRARNSMQLLGEWAR